MVEKWAFRKGANKILAFAKALAENCYSVNLVVLKSIGKFRKLIANVEICALLFQKLQRRFS
jgi:hypothetical protein